MNKTKLDIKISKDLEKKLFQSITFDNDFLQTIESVILKASAEIMRIYSGEIKVELKSDSSPVTAADKKASEVIESMLGSYYGLDVVSEENIEKFTQEQLKDKIYWLVDPIDGTKHFIKKDGEFSVNIALMAGSSVVAGFIYIPTTKEFFYSTHFTGACKVEDLLTHNSPPISIKVKNLSENSNDEIKILTGSQLNSSKMFTDFYESLGENHKVSKESLGSSIKMCRVAEGKAHIFPRFGGTCEWDTAAAFSILKRAGGNMITIPHYEEVSFLQGFDKWENPYFIATCDLDIEWLKNHINVDHCRVGKQRLKN